MLLKKIEDKNIVRYGIIIIKKEKDKYIYEKLINGFINN